MLHATALTKHRGELITVNSQQERTILFDLLPLRGVGFHGFDIRFQLVAVPGQAPYGAMRRLVMRGTDALVFVANSAADRLDENRASLWEMHENLKANALDFRPLPLGASVVPGSRGRAALPSSGTIRQTLLESTRVAGP